MASPSVAEVTEAIAAIVATDVDAKAEVLPGSDLLHDLRLDSLTLMTLVVGLEDRFRVVLTEDDAEGVRTVEELAALVVRKAAA